MKISLNRTYVLVLFRDRMAEFVKTQFLLRTLHSYKLLVVKSKKKWSKHPNQKSKLVNHINVDISEIF